MESQIQLNEERKKLRDKFSEALPDVISAESAVLSEVYKDGALSAKVKRLISLAIALRVGCTNCVLAQTMNALDAGASKDEILETLSVESAMTGTSARGRLHEVEHF